MPKVSEEHLEARRAQILDGARRTFARHGYDGATVAKLEEQIGLSRGAIFNYFGSKRDLFVALAIEENRRYVGLIVERGFDDALRTMAGEDPEWIGMLLEIYGRLRHDEEFVRRLDDQTDQRDRLAAWLDEEQRAGRYRQDVESIHIGRFASMLLNGLALRVAGGDPVDVEPIIRLLHDALDSRE